MKIAILTPGGVDRSGTDRVIPCLLWLIERLVAAGDEVHVFALAQEPVPGRWTLLGAQVHNAGRRPRAGRMLASIVAEHRRAGFAIIHAFWAVPCGLIGGVAARMLGVPLMLTLPGGDAVRHRGIGYGGRLRIGGRIKLRLAVAASDAVTVPSDDMRHQVALLGIAATTIPLGVALDRWPIRAPVRRIQGAPLRLLHVGSLNPVKDQGTLLEAAALLKASGYVFDLTVIGWDTLDGAVHRLASALALTAHVRFLGFVPHAAMRDWFDRTDLLIVSSIHEAGPLVMLEAAIAGVPTVGTAVGHIADYAPDAAMAVPVGDPGALADAILALAGDEDRRICLAIAAQARAADMDADSTLQSTRAAYHRMAGRSVGE